MAFMKPKGMLPEQEARYDAAMEDRRRALESESIESVQRRYGLDESGYSPTSSRRNLQLARLYKQYQTAPDERSRQDYARQIKSVEMGAGSSHDKFNRGMELTPLMPVHAIGTEGLRRIDAIEYGDAENTDVFLRDQMRRKRGE